MPITLDGSLGVTTPTYNGNTTAEYLVPVTAFKNKLINGQMQIDQRNASAAQNAINNSTYMVDRWGYYATQAGKFNAQQNAGSVTTPAGFSNYLGMTVASAVSVGAGDRFGIFQAIEGFNTADLNWGTANAQTVTLSFWVRSSITGTHSGSVTNYAVTRSYPFSFTISSANTWEQKSVTITGDTSGTWVGASSAGALYLNFNLGAGSALIGTAGSWSSSALWGVTGSVSVVGTNGATFYLTGVQLEKGSTATSFDYRPYGTEFALCQRYFQRVGDGGNPYAVLGVGRFGSATAASLRFPWSVVMRATPSATFNTATYQLTDGTTARSVGAISIYSAGTDGCEGDIVTSSATNGNMTQLRGNAAAPNAPYINLSAEL